MHLIDEEFSQRHERIGSIKIDVIIAGDKQCHTHKAGIVNFSPEVIFSKKRGGFWNLVVKEKEGGNVNTIYIRCKAAKVDIASSLSVDLATSIENKKDAYGIFHKLKLKATVYRKRCLYQS